MSIYKIKSGVNKGKYRVRVQKRVDGKIIPFPSKVFRTKAEARKGEAQMLLDFEQLNPLAMYGDLTQPLSIALDKYVEEQWRLKRWSSESTYKSWKYLVKVTAEFMGQKRAFEVKTHDIDVWVHEYVEARAEKGIQVSISPHSTLAKMLQNLRKFYSDMGEFGALRNPVPIRPISYFFRRDQQVKPKEKRVLTNAEIAAITKEIYQELLDTKENYWPSRIAILLCLSCGFRPQEVSALRFSDLVLDPADGKTPVFKIHDAWDDSAHALRGMLKSRRPGEYRYTLPIPEELYRLLKSYEIKQKDILRANGLANDNDFILLNMTNYEKCALGYPITKHGMNDMFKKICQSLGMKANDISIYTCRHTVITKLVNSGSISVSWLASRCGHTPETLRKYYLHEDKDISKAQLAVTQKVTQTFKNGL
ncbi:tyrosine-type recombinase/integrase [Lactobacillus delbrueckii]|uniref:tyrosine-type recombinase/integrase n=1 Tax=Lactobacillus delbrueckii TaxID=1584 RepID=UPI001E4021C3|nr:tyrosine-type recombinase/integrase [Lactobacillus delbrueckii]MCD5543709.1 site-specific integrase [Lactobacillus delbrueckii subsp. lactis]